MTRRIASAARFFILLIIIVAALIAIRALGLSAIDGVNDLVHRYQSYQLHQQQKSAFPGTATAIGQLNATMIYEQTHAPTATETPIPPTDVPIPTDVPDVPDVVTATMTETLPPESTVPPTNTKRPTLPPLDSTATSADVSTVTPS